MIRVLVADYSRACLFETPSYGSSLVQLAALVNPDARLPERELGSDAPGRVYNRSSGVHQAYERRHFRDNALRRFAGEIGKFLETSLHSGECEGIVLVAAPRFLSELRRALPQTVRNKLLGQIPKDLAKRPMSLISKQLRNARENRGLALRAAS